jgi:hypothetical protein
MERTFEKGQGMCDIVRATILRQEEGGRGSGCRVETRGYVIFEKVKPRQDQKKEGKAPERRLVYGQQEDYQRK